MQFIIAFSPIEKLSAATPSACQLLHFSKTKFLVGILAKTSDKWILSIANLATRSHEEIHLELMKRYGKSEFLWAGEIHIEEGKIIEVNETSGFFALKKLKNRVVDLASFAKIHLSSWVNRKAKFSSFNSKKPHVTDRPYDIHKIKTTQMILDTLLNNLIEIKKNREKKEDKYGSEADIRKMLRDSEDLKEFGLWIDALAKEGMINHQKAKWAILTLKKAQSTQAIESEEIETLLANINEFKEKSNDNKINPIEFLEFDF